MNGQVREQGVDRNTDNGATELEVHVQCRLGRQIRDFHMEVTEEGIILRGRVQTYYAKQLAQHAVMEATTLPIVANQIEVT